MKHFFLVIAAFSLIALSACNNENSNSAGTETNKDSMGAGSNMSAGDTNSTAGGAGTSTNDQPVTANGLAMTSAQEVPANSSKGGGTADVSYNKGTHMLRYTLNWKGLTANPTMAHIHGTAPKGTNAGVKVDLTGKLPKTASGTLTDSVMVDGNQIKEDSLLSGFYYFNIHTPKNPGGEIRAQIDFGGQK